LNSDRPFSGTVPGEVGGSVTIRLLLALAPFVLVADGATVWMRAALLRHYSSSVLFSERARGEFVEPDIAPIPRYG
jgi:hypothetical protein